VQEVVKAALPSESRARSGVRAIVFNTGREMVKQDLSRLKKF
jgi:hypothetical protein